ncbi:putative kelch-type beta propeller [Helianthus annuus]|uniref:Kelch-type beta propeller n=1 Tax=Helianthus annuus TaxID=4232 RepID=A0A9K3IKX3_HELAN|nr:putative kelch-type beta propeller [Helianthus annuus]KAJ0549928.1 putative kelch-type beta propeller [Helianthus annuus]KAJ0556486.1 putative kelch-type beta propeller [Helianthus annuus]KAJ0562886.1 putative kelch-type beta propeller [Helianthus annuus]KAJ0731026.1 putative kelch-type beta propeller [Helianthus annuus]
MDSKPTSISAASANSIPTHIRLTNLIACIDIFCFNRQTPPTPRAGHAGVSIDEKWFLAGGGDNKNGASETLVMDMHKLVISVLTNVKGRHPLASEGLSVSSAFIDDDHFLVAFGGYNGKYNNEG